jgi:hypothetical protein
MSELEEWALDDIEAAAVSIRATGVALQSALASLDAGEVGGARAWLLTAHETLTGCLRRLSQLEGKLKQLER